MEPFFQSNYLETSVNADLEITKVTINRMELVVEDVEIANREVAKLTGARTVRKNHPLRSRVKLKPLSKRPNRLSPLRRKNLRKKDSPTKNT
jgi:hypothetical protein